MAKTATQPNFFVFLPNRKIIIDGKVTFTFSLIIFLKGCSNADQQGKDHCT
jgi:hypothetical protein